MTAFEKVKYFIVQKYFGFEPAGGIDLNTRLSEDLGIEGDDAIDFFEMFLTEFSVDQSSLDLTKYFHGEGFAPFSFFIGLFKNNRLITLRVKDLVRSIEAGKWVEPDDE